MTTDGGALSETSETAPVEAPREAPRQIEWPRAFRAQLQHEENLRYARWRGRMNLDRMRYRRYVRDESNMHIWRTIGNFGRKWFPWLNVRLRF